RLRRVARWILAFPVAVGCAWAAWYESGFAYRFGMVWVGVDPTSFLSNPYFELISSVVMGAAFVYVGARIAPDYKRETTLVLAAIGLLAVGANIFASLSVGNYSALWPDLWLVVGMGLTVFSVFSGELDVGSSASGWGTRSTQ